MEGFFCKNIAGNRQCLLRKQGNIINVYQNMLVNISVCAQAIKEYKCNSKMFQYQTVNQSLILELRPKKQRIDQAINNEEWGF